jgi:hypothetical protein
MFESRIYFRGKGPRSSVRPGLPREQFEKQYRAALSGAVVAKAYYLAQLGERLSTPSAIERARRKWQCIESHRQRLAAHIQNLDTQTLSCVESSEDASQPPMDDLFANQPTPVPHP